MVAARRTIALLLCCFLAACAAGPGEWEVDSDELGLSPEALERFRTAVYWIETDDAGAARAALQSLSREYPGELHVLTWLQEAELALGVRSPGGAIGESDQAAADALRRAYRERAENSDDASDWILAARIEPDPPAALLLLARARELDERSAWAHYATAFVLARQGDWNEARAALDRALELEPTHLGARRLEAWMIARSGKLDIAARAVRRWLRESQGVPWVSERARTDARLDLALLLVGAGQPSEARAILLDLTGHSTDNPRVLTVLAAAEQALGRSEEALDAAREAELLEPGDFLPIVQQALLFEHWLQDPDKAREAWERVLAETLDDQELAALLQRTQAQVRLERWEEERGAEPAPEEPPR